METLFHVGTTLSFQGGETTISHVLLLARMVGDKDMTLGFSLFQHHVPQHSFVSLVYPILVKFVGEKQELLQISIGSIGSGTSVLGGEFRLHVEIEYAKVDDCCSACESFHCEKYLYLLHNIHIFKQQIKENSTSYNHL